MSDIEVKKLLAGNVSPLTLEAYAIAWAQYWAYAGGRRRALQSETLVAWRQHLVNETDRSRSTINKSLYAVKAVVKALYAHKHVSRETHWEFRDVSALPANALTSRKRAHARTRISPDEMRRMVSAAEAEPHTLTRLYHRAFLLTLATTGMRISECCRIRASDLVPHGDHCVVTNVLAKAKGEPRDVPISAEACAAIGEWLDARPDTSDYIFNASGYGDGLRYADKPVHRVTAGDIVRRYAKKVGLAHIKPHDFRRFVGTRLAQKDLRLAQKVLGHASPTTTAQFYVLDDVTPGSTEGLF